MNTIARMNSTTFTVEVVEEYTGTRLKVFGMSPNIIGMNELFETLKDENKWHEGYTRGKLCMMRHVIEPYDKMQYHEIIGTVYPKPSKAEY